MKRIVAWLAVLAVLGGMGAPALAGAGISPMFINVMRVDLGLTFSGTTANCSGVIEALPGTSEITATFTLQRRESNGTYTNIRHWVQGADGNVLRFSGTHPITTGHTYRLSMTARVIRNGVFEFISDRVENRP
jgi:hypothetical protein